MINGVYPCKLWINEKFWLKFFDAEVRDSSIDDFLVNNISIMDESIFGELNKNDVREDCLATLCDIMYRLNLNKNFIKKVVFDTLAVENGIKSEKLDELRMQFEN